MKNTLIKYHIVEKLGRACYLVQTEKSNGEYYVLKKQPKIIYFKQHISRAIFAGSLPFQNEFRILNLIKNHKHIPQLPVLDAKQNQYYILPYIKDSLKFTELQKETYKIIGASVAEISKLPMPQKWWSLKEYMFNKLSCVSSNLLKKIKLFETKHGTALISLIELHEQVILISKSIKPRLIHNDLSDNNVIIDQSENLYFIDWEDARIENKAIFLDLISISFNRKDFSLNPYIVHAFWKNYERKNFEEEQIVVLLSYSYIAYLFKLMHMKRYDDSFKNRIKNHIETYNKKMSLLFNFIEQNLK